MAPIPTTVLVAPDSFKGTLSAVSVAEAIGRGLRRGGRPVELCPVADGGEGTLQVLAPALQAELVGVRVSDPLGRAVQAEVGLGRAPDGRRVAAVEMAAASGLGLVAPDERDPLRASTAGTGELILAAGAAGAVRRPMAAGGRSR